MTSRISAAVVAVCLLSLKADATCPGGGGNNACSGSNSAGWGWQYYNNSSSASASLVGGDPTNAVSGYGVEGVVANSNTSPAVYGSSGTASTSVGVEGVYNGSAKFGYAIYGSAGGYGLGTLGISSEGIGAEGMTQSACNASNCYPGALGWNSGYGPGVYGYATNGVGVVGENAYLDNDGIQGYSDSGYSGGSFYNYGSGAGVYATGGGYAAYLVGVSSGDGVYAYSPSGYAGYFAGKVYVSGYLSKPGGGFLIDHPADPANKYLVHSFVESPDMKNVYDGIATLDQTGHAVVQLPSYFDAENSDYRYQLTSLGRYAPVYVAQEISGSQFTIAGGIAGQRVSWQVTGIREDPWVVAHRVVPEVAKTPLEQGKYLQPQEVAGLTHSASTQIGWRPPPLSVGATPPVVDAPAGPPPANSVCQ